MSRLAEAVAPPRLGPDFRWLVGSTWLTNLGDGVRLAAGPLLIEAMTDDATLVGLSWMLGRLPWLLFGLHSGYLADRLNRKLIVMTAHSVRVVILVLFALVIRGDVANVPLVLAALFLLSTTEVFADNTTATFLPMLVEKEDLSTGNSRLQVGFVTLNQLVGPPIGAFLFATAMWIPWMVTPVFVLAAIAMVSRIVLPEELATAGGEEPGRPGERIAEGIRWVRGNPPLRTLALTIFFFNVTFGGSFSVIVVLATKRLGMSELGFGLLISMSAVGGILGAVLYGRTERRFGIVTIMRVGLLIEAFTHLVLAITTTAAVAMAMLFLFGMHEAMWATTSRSMRQAMVPNQLQGRVGSVYSVGLQSGLILGAGLGALLAGAVDITAPYWFGFVGTSIVLATIWKSLANIAAAAS